jgi:hypothetical protein
MSLLAPLRRWLVRSLQRDIDHLRDDTDAALDELERQGKPFSMTDAAWVEMQERHRRAEQAGLITDRDRARFARVRKMAGR